VDEADQENSDIGQNRSILSTPQSAPAGSCATPGRHLAEMQRLATADCTRSPASHCDLL